MLRHRLGSRRGPVPHPSVGTEPIRIRGILGARPVVAASDEQRAEGWS